MALGIKYLAAKMLLGLIETTKSCGMISNRQPKFQ